MRLSFSIDGKGEHGRTTSVCSGSDSSETQTILQPARWEETDKRNLCAHLRMLTACHTISSVPRTCTHVCRWAFIGLYNPVNYPLAYVMKRLLESLCYAGNTCVPSHHHGVLMSVTHTWATWVCGCLHVSRLVCVRARVCVLSYLPAFPGGLTLTGWWNFVSR